MNVEKPSEMHLSRKLRQRAFRSIVLFIAAFLLAIFVFDLVFTSNEEVSDVTSLPEQVRTSSRRLLKKKKSFMDNRFRVQHTKPPKNAIFFLGMANAKYLSSKLLCGIESAARHHPKRTVVLAVFDPWFIVGAPGREVLSNYNFRLIHLNISEWGLGTPLHHVTSLGLMDDADVEDPSAAEVLGCMALFKYGGVYLENDVIVIKPFDTLEKNAIGLEGNMSWSRAAGNVMIFERGHPVMENCVKESFQCFNGMSWQEKGSTIPIVINKWCGEPEESTKLQPRTCKGVQILSTRAFNPVPMSKWQYLFKNNETTTKKIFTLARASFAVHHWQGVSVNATVRIGSEQPIATLARLHCPLTVKAYPNSLWSEFTGLW